VNPKHFEDPVVAYDRLSAHYSDLSRRREAYLLAIEREIISRTPPRGRSLLDVGAGDGTRALRIATQLRIGRVVLAEPSHKMISESILETMKRAEVWPLRAEDLGRRVLDSGGEAAKVGAARAETFDVITCLWNVFGHIPNAQKRLRALHAIARLLAANGIFFLDVNHRYNVRSYGWFPTSARWIRDLFWHDENTGDVVAQWDTGDDCISTYGHVFMHREIAGLAHASGLDMKERIVVDYETGSRRRLAFQGNLLYVFRRNSLIDTSNPPQTS